MRSSPILLEELFFLLGTYTLKELFRHKHTLFMSTSSYQTMTKDVTTTGNIFSQLYRANHHQNRSRAAIT
jgi:hypothetical protein